MMRFCIHHNTICALPSLHSITTTWVYASRRQEPCPRVRIWVCLGVYMRVRGPCVEKYCTFNSTQTESWDQSHEKMIYEMIGPKHDCIWLYVLIPTVGSLTEYFKIFKSRATLNLQVKARHICTNDDIMVMIKTKVRIDAFHGIGIPYRLDQCIVLLSSLIYLNLHVICFLP